MATPGPETFLSERDEWIAAGVGIVIAAAIALFTQTPVGYTAAAIFAIVVLIPRLPQNIGEEWHYWLGAIVLAYVMVFDPLNLGISEWISSMLLMF